MDTIADCKLLSAQADVYLRGHVSTDEKAALESHLESCAACRETMDQFRAVSGLMGYLQVHQANRTGAAAAVPPLPLAGKADEPQSSWTVRAASAPWWFVSCSLHVLIIVLAGLVSMAIEMPRSNDDVIMVTELQSRSVINEEEKRKAEPPETALLSKKDVAATDPASKDVSDIVVPPDILAKAELGDHFQTINPDRPDSHSAYGIEDSKSLHAVNGDAGKAGGGGMGGVGMEDVVGVGGAVSRGSGSGFGGGDGGGVGAGKGAGTGSFGQRSGGGRKLMVRRNGGSAATENAVDKALHWLAYHQEPDGSWQIEKHGGNTGKNAKLKDTCFVGVTALAALAFLGAGHSTRVGEYKDNVQRAINWLISKQAEDGGIGFNNGLDGWSDGSGYNHPIAGMALAEACAMANDPKIREAARKAVYYTLDKYWDSKNKVWHYALPEAYHGGKPDDANISVIAWFVMQLKSARMAHIDVDHSYFVMVNEWLDKDKKPGGDGYGIHQYHYASDTWGKDGYSQPATAMALVCRLFMGTPANELESGGDYLLKKLPQWDAQNGGASAPRGPCPHYYWYYGTLVMFQMGGDYWKQWNEALKNTLIPNQRNDGDFAGSWDLLGSDGPCAGRAYTTAMGAMSLEVYYRYLQLADKK